MAIINALIDEEFNGYLSITSSNVGITGESPTISLQRKSDSKYWDNGTSDWVVAVTNNSMTEYDSTNEPGIYRYYSSADITSSEDTIVVHYNNTGTYALNAYDILYVRKDFATNIATSYGNPLASTPSADSTSLQDMINFLYQALRNKSISDTTKVYIHDSGGSVISEAAITKIAGEVERAAFANP